MKNIKKLGSLILTLILAFSLTLPAFAAAENTGYTDVDANAPYAGAVIWCREHQLMDGVGGGRFDPDGSMTRAMLAAILYRQAGEPPVENAPAFTDVRPNMWYTDAIVWASEREILRGYGGEKFGTNDPVSKEMLSVVIARQKGDDPAWTGAPELAVNAKRSEAAVALYETFAEPTPAPQPTPSEGGKVLIAYFSATNNTEGIANHMKAALGDHADLYEITPETPYTTADLNYNTDCRANREQNDPSSRPAISGSVENMAQYNVIFLGYPIWWGQAPKIISTFLESYDLSGKTIVPFCTSGSSPMGSSATNLHSLASSATWLDGQRFSGSASRSVVETWMNGLDLKLIPEN